jgi:hypothetical protein
MCLLAMGGDGPPEKDASNMNRPSKWPLAGDVVVIKVARHYHVSRVEGDSTVLSAIGVENRQDEALDLAHRFVMGDQRVFLFEDANSLTCVEIECEKLRSL